MSAVRNFVITLLVSLLIFGFVTYGLIEFATSAFSTADEEDKKPSDDNVITTTDQGGTVDPPEILDGIEGESMTILFVGTDYQPDVYDDYEYADKRPDGFDGTVREIETDTIILVRINKETGECLFCPIPSITEIKINGHPSTLKKLYYYKGIDVLRDQITVLTGLPIDYHAVVTMDSLKNIIDELGGIEFYVPQSMNYVDPIVGIDINLKAGNQVLDGKNATDMLRYWSYADEDTSRRRLGGEFLKALVSKIVNDIPMKDAATAYIKYSKFIDTDFTVGDLSEHADLIYAFSKLSIKDYTYPGTATGTGPTATFIPNIDSALKFFDTYKFKG